MDRVLSEQSEAGPNRTIDMAEQLVHIRELIPIFVPKRSYRRL